MLAQHRRLAVVTGRELFLLHSCLQSRQLLLRRRMAQGLRARRLIFDIVWLERAALSFDPRSFRCLCPCSIIH